MKMILTGSGIGQPNHTISLQIPHAITQAIAILNSNPSGPVGNTMVNNRGNTILMIY